MTIRFNVTTRPIELLKVVQQDVEMMTNLVPTGPMRNDLSDANIHLLSALEKLALVNIPGSVLTGEPKQAEGTRTIRQATTENILAAVARVNHVIDGTSGALASPRRTSLQSARAALNAALVVVEREL